MPTHNNFRGRCCVTSNAHWRNRKVAIRKNLISPLLTLGRNILFWACIVPCFNVSNKVQVQLPQTQCSIDAPKPTVPYHSAKCSMVWFSYSHSAGSTFPPSFHILQAFHNFLGLTRLHAKHNITITTA